MNQKIHSICAEFYVAHPALTDLISFLRTVDTLELLDVSAGATVLDLGAWPGVISYCASRLGYRVCALDKEPERGLDWNLEALLDERWREQRTGPSLREFLSEVGVEVSRADIELDRFPFDDNSVDAVLLTEVIEHLWVNPFHTLKEINRVLKPNGTLIVSTPNLLSALNRVEFLLGRISNVIEHPFVAYLKRERVGHMGHLRLYAPTELRDLLSLFGFQGEWQFRGRETGSWPGAAVMGRRRGKRLKNPKELIDAIRATSVALLERIVPELRPQIFVRAKKIGTTNLQNSSRISQLVLTNK